MEVLLSLKEIAIRVNRDEGLVEHFVRSEWIRPAQAAAEDGPPAFDHEDLARVHLILDLRESFGVNDEAVPIILDLLDQVHRLRRLTSSRIQDV